MPELPDITLYCEAIAQRLQGQALQAIRLASPFVLRTALPPYQEAIGRTVVGTQRLGKRVVIEFQGDLYFVIHLMVAGRFRWLQPGAKLPGKISLVAFDFPNGTLLLTEAGAKKRASWHVVQGQDGLTEMDPGGLEVLAASLDDFSTALTRENRTVKRALTDPHVLSGIGNAYSDEILHAASLSPAKRTQDLTASELHRLFEACHDRLSTWTERLRTEIGDQFPSNVTAFRPDFAAHGRFGEPCPRCAAPIQRITYAANESNYCAPCQTGGKLLADRAFSRLLKGDWPRTLEDLEQVKARHRSMLADG